MVWHSGSPALNPAFGQGLPSSRGLGENPVRMRATARSEKVKWRGTPRCSPQCNAMNQKRASFPRVSFSAKNFSRNIAAAGPAPETARRRRVIGDRITSGRITRAVFRGGTRKREAPTHEPSAAGNQTRGGRRSKRAAKPAGTPGGLLAGPAMA